MRVKVVTSIITPFKKPVKEWRLKIIFFSIANDTIGLYFLKTYKYNCIPNRSITFY